MCMCVNLKAVQVGARQLVIECTTILITEIEN
jgi:hypothetical protein